MYSNDRISFERVNNSRIKNFHICQCVSAAVAYRDGFASRRVKRRVHARRAGCPGRPPLLRGVSRRSVASTLCPHLDRACRPHRARVHLAIVQFADRQTATATGVPQPLLASGSPPRMSNPSLQGGGLFLCANSPDTATKLWGSGAFFLPPQGMYYHVSRFD